MIDILFFFGAGASAAFGIPTMRDMTNDFRGQIESNNLKNEQKVYNEIHNFLQKDLGDNGVDIEAIFSVIDGLKTYKVGNIGELALYASRKIYNKTLIDGGAFYDMQTLNSLEIFSAIYQKILPDP